MARVKRGVTAKARHKKVLEKAKGYYGARSKLFKTAKQAVIKAGQYAYRDRRQRKRQFRALWITRINAAARLHGLSYSRLINGLNLAKSKSTARCWPISRCTIRKASARLPTQAKAALAQKQLTVDRPSAYSPRDLTPCRH